MVWDSLKDFFINRFATDYPCFEHPDMHVQKSFCCIRIKVLKPGLVNNHHNSGEKLYRRKIVRHFFYRFSKLQ